MQGVGGVAGKLCGVVLAAAMVVTGCSGSPGHPAESGGTVRGVVTDRAGQPVGGASVRLGSGQRIRTAASGEFAAAGRTPGFLVVRAAGYLSRVVAARAEDDIRIGLTRGGPGALSLRFGGDVMAGRRFYDQNDDGDGRDGLLVGTASAADHVRLLGQIAPLLGDADLTAVNLETPLLRQPWSSPLLPRPARLHHDKAYAYASSPALAAALVHSGVDVVSLANNHVYDGLQPGLTATLAALDAASLPHFGAGATVADAWRPAVLTTRGQRVAYLGCTTITGREHAQAYVAEAHQGGAARCTRSLLARAVREASAAAPTVVVMIHGGEEYVDTQTALVRSLTEVAEQAGADLVVNGHPHVPGGVGWDGRAVVAESMGNLLFDQDVWSTQRSFLLRVDVRAGHAVAASVDPLLIEDYQPVPAFGLAADTVLRQVAGQSGLSGFGLTGIWPPPSTTSPPVTRQLHGGEAVRLAPGWWAEPTPAAVAGADLLWTGSVEDDDGGPADPAQRFWRLTPRAVVSAAAACHGSAGFRLSAPESAADAAILTTRHRQLVAGGVHLSLLAEVRRSSGQAFVELHWYRGTAGASETVERIAIPAHSGADCSSVRLDAVVPPGIVAVQPYLRAEPGAAVDADDIALVRWGPAGRAADTITATRDITLTLRDDDAGPAERDPFVLRRSVG
jgi:poly-gamma-glutamate synthesis protein (capsule biosynthesis protein)